jgi:hypothetical protein
MTIAKARKGTFRLPTGQRVKSNNPIKEFELNVRARWAMLKEAETGDDPDLAHTWQADALARRKGITSIEDRAEELRMDVDGLIAFDAKVAELELDIWKKAADFYRGLLAWGIFEKTVLVHGGVYHDHEFWSWAHLKATYGLSRSTFLRRLKAGTTVADLFRPARPKARVTYLEGDGIPYNASEFACMFDLPLAHVRAGIANGMSGEEILRAPRAARGRPRKARPVGDACNSATSA